jgi:flagellin
MNGIYVNKHINRLSSGYRVSTPADDPAGYAISQRMGGQVLSYNAAVRNTNDGANLLQTASGALQTDNAILLKMRQLAIEASNGTYSGKDLTVLNQEYLNLKKELSRVSKVTDFNGMKLLDGSHKDFKFQVGIGTNPENRLKVKIGKMDAKTLNLEGTSLMSRSHSLHSVKALD